MDALPPFLFGAKTAAEKSWLARLKAAGRVWKIGPRLYTSLPQKDVSSEAKKLWLTIVPGLFPGALMSHRTALEYKPSPDGIVFLTGNTNRRISYPGLQIEFIRGPGPLPDDPDLLGLRASSRARAFLENLSRDERRATSRTLPQDDLEHRLEQLLRDAGRDEVLALRTRAKEIAGELGWRAEYERLDRMIGALLGTKPADGVVSANARARAIGVPFDSACVERLQLLFGELQSRALRSLPDVSTSPKHFTNKAFFDAYFSNYIEGTVFEIEEAESIIFERKLPADRPKDAHDIIGTFAVLSDPTEMRRTPASDEELIELVRSRHRKLLGARSEVRPGEFKQRRNRAGDTHFVLPEYVVGTLKKGFELYQALERGIERAIFIMFLVSDVHPFDDGNGRMGRVMLNSELVAAEASTAIIPTVYRDDYVLALRALTQRNRPTPLVDAVTKAAHFSNLDFSNYPRVLAELERRNWFRHPEDAKIVIG